MNNGKLTVELLKLTLDLLPEGVLLVDSSRNVIYYNERFREMWRIPSGVLVSPKNQTLLEFVNNQVKGADLFISEEEFMYAGVEPFQDEISSKDGRVFNRKSMVFDDETYGNIRMWIFADVTNRKRSEYAAATNEYWLQAVFESMGEGLIVHRIMPDGTPGAFEHVNPVWRKKLGYSQEELSRLSPAEIDDPEIAMQVIPTVMKNLEKFGSDTFESTQVRKDGSKIPVAVHARVFTFQKQKWIISVLNDLTKRKKEQKEREELINKLERMLAEIKTLRGILPICSICKNIRNDDGYYEQIEEYIHKHTGVDFSHTICHRCLEKHYPEEFEDIEKNKKR